MALQAAYAATPVIGSAELTTADTTTRGTPTTVGTVITGGASGTRLSKIIIQGAGTTIAGLIRLWLYDGTNYRMIKEVAVPAKTVSSTSPDLPQTILSESTNIDLLPITLPSASWSLRATVTTTQTGSGVNVIAIGANL